MYEYTTRQGDTFESVAWFQMGKSGAMVDLIRENPQYMDVAEFEAGVTLRIPEIEETGDLRSDSTPPWR